MLSANTEIREKFSFGNFEEMTSLVSLVCYLPYAHYLTGWPRAYLYTTFLAEFAEITKKKNI